MCHERAGSMRQRELHDTVTQPDAVPPHARQGLRHIDSESRLFGLDQDADGASQVQLAQARDTTASSLVDAHQR